MRIFLFATLLFVCSACNQVNQTESPLPPVYTSSPSAWWQPEPGLSWQWQLSDSPVDLDVQVEAFDVDLFDTAPGIIDTLHQRGVKVICYISVGSWEDWRPDADLFPVDVIGKAYDGWEGEKWLDIRQLDKLAPLMSWRLDLCKAKGFDAVEPDNLEIWDNPTGFPLAYSDQLNYARWLADETHRRGLAIGLKNAPDMVVDLVDLYDFAVTEDCFDQGWCEQMLPFIQAGKAVFAAEYVDAGIDFVAACAWGRQEEFSVILKTRDLTAWLDNCP